MTDSCEACGWIAAVLAMLAFGSFAAPIKSRVVVSLDVDPLVFQTYKTALCFATCWIVLLLGYPFSFSPWGIVSGLFWVPGGVATIFAVKTAGMAVGVGVASSFIVLVSFTWGIFIFQENVKSKIGACFAVILMVVGIIGMAFYSVPESFEREVVPVILPQRENQLLENRFNDDVRDCSDETYIPDTETIATGENSSLQEYVSGRRSPRYFLGILAAVFNGLWGGSIMVPMHWSGESTKGINYIISFAIGASIINILFWIARFCWTAADNHSIKKAYNSMPSFHFKKMWLQGCTSGLLWSIGNFFSVISVANLGEGIGYSVIQAGMLVSGIWGIFYFGEVTNRRKIFLWFLSAGVTVTGIILLSFEHLK